MTDRKKPPVEGTLEPASGTGSDQTVEPTLDGGEVKKKKRWDYKPKKKLARHKAALAAIPRHEVDRILKIAEADGLPILDEYFSGQGIPYTEFKLALERALDENPDPDDLYLLRSCQRAQSNIIISCFKEWKRGNRNAGDILKNTVKRYNAEYMSRINTDLRHFMLLAKRHISHDQYTKILQDIVSFEPGFNNDQDDNTLRLPSIEQDYSTQGGHGDDDEEE